MSEWKEYRLGDILSIKSGFSYKGKFIGTGNSLLLGMGCVSFKEKFLISGARPYSGPYDERYKVHSGDIVLATRQQSDNLPILAMPAMVPDSLQDKDIVIGTNLYKVEINDTTFSNVFIYWLLKTKQYVNYIAGVKTGTTVSMVTKKNVEDFTFFAPTNPKEREEIVSIISYLDDKIAVNRKICENLEAQAQALFKHWFVDFAPFKDGNFCANREQNETCFNSAEVQPKITGKACKFVESELGMIPEGWRVGTLTEIAEYLNGLAMQKFPPLSADDAIPVLKIKELGQSQCDNNSDKCSKQIKSEYIIKNGDVVFSWSGTLMVDIWCGGICGLNQHLFKVTSDNYPKWFYLMWTKHHLAEFIRIAKDKAVTMGHIKRGDLEKALVAIPDSDTLDKMSKVMEDIHNQIINTRLESNSLSTLRDTLLPKLMSGQIKV